MGVWQRKVRGPFLSDMWYLDSLKAKGLHESEQPLHFEANRRK
jgi:hypothetical protein